MCACAQGVASAGPPRGDGPTALQLLLWADKPVYCGGDTSRLVALTFDDGPGPWTLPLVAVLRGSRAPATFFLVGSRLAYWPQGARAAAQAGAVGNHTWTHPRLPKLSARAVRRELQRTQTEILAVTQKLPAVFRPPYGRADARVERIARDLNLLDVRWNVDSGDARPGATAARVVRTVAETVRPGSIVLLHDAHPWTAQAVRLILRNLKRQHLHPVTLQTLFERDPPQSGCA